MDKIISSVQSNQKAIDEQIRQTRNCPEDRQTLREVSSIEEIPEEIRKRHPLITPSAYNGLKKVAENPNAPKWNYLTIGDEVTSEDVDAARDFREQFFLRPYTVETSRAVTAPADKKSSSASAAHIPLHHPSKELLSFVLKTAEKSKWFSDAIREGMDLKKDWHTVKTMQRSDIARNLIDIVPQGDNYDRLIVYDTSGTTGHSIVVPHHPKSLAMNHVFAEYALKAWGKTPEFTTGKTACINVCAQQTTYVFYNTYSVWNGASFAKVNLNPTEWSTGMKGAQAFFKDLAPQFITADPITISEMVSWELPIQPLAIFSTALELSEPLRKKAEEFFNCPVINWYSTTETGPVAFASPACKEVPGTFEIFGPDIYVEILDANGFPCPAGEIGEITVSGGRNPWLPLLRYRTGDYAEMSEDGKYLINFHGREPVVFRATNGSVINTIDVARTLRIVCPFVQHQFIQHKDASCTLKVSPLPTINVNKVAIEKAVKEIFGEEQNLSIEIVDTPAEKKLVPFISEMD